MIKGNVGPTVRDVANVAGVSTTTVSRFLNGKYDAMSEATRKRIEEAIRKLRYMPNMAARTLRNSRSHTLGIVFADISVPYSIAVLHGAEKACTELGYSLMVCNSNEDVSKEKDNINMVISKQVDGLLINSTGKNDDFLISISENLPVVLIDRRLSSGHLYCVSSNNRQGISLAVGHLLDQGCTNISFIVASPQGISPRYERIQAFEEIARTLGESYNLQVYIVEYNSMSEIGNVIQTTVRNAHLSGGRSGLVVGNGLLSLVVLKSLRELNLRSPDDLLVVGFDDPDWASIAHPTLTVISQPEFSIGETAARSIISIIKDDQKNEDEGVVELDVNLIVRESTTILK